ncbi:hypothetical protein BJ912DRAFT_385481 [Pholiota molesta]|nr:hypothetical protein BJ912DRAFT_385481 [Pholiota molesta]
MDLRRVLVADVMESTRLRSLGHISTDDEALETWTKAVFNSVQIRRSGLLALIQNASTTAHISDASPSRIFFHHCSQPRPTPVTDIQTMKCFEKIISHPHLFALTTSQEQISNVILASASGRLVSDLYWELSQEGRRWGGGELKESENPVHESRWAPILFAAGLRSQELIKRAINEFFIDSLGAPQVDAVRNRLSSTRLDRSTAAEYHVSRGATREV